MQGVDSLGGGLQSLELFLYIHYTVSANVLYRYCFYCSHSQAVSIISLRFRYARWFH